MNKVQTFLVWLITLITGLVVSYLFVSRIQSHDLAMVMWLFMSILTGLLSVSAAALVYRS